MESYKLHQWLRSDVTQFMIREMGKVKEEALSQLLSYSPGTENINELYFYLRGKIDGIEEFLNYEIEEDRDEDVQRTGSHR